MVYMLSLLDQEEIHKGVQATVALNISLEWDIVYVQMFFFLFFLI